MEESEYSKLYRMYLDDLEGVREYGEEERIACYKALLRGDENAEEAILLFSLPVVLRVADKYAQPGLVTEDLVQEGNMALMLRLRELCGSGQACDVEQELYDSVDCAVMQYASGENGYREQEEALVGKLNLVEEARKLLTEENGIAPTLPELSEYTGISVEELRELNNLQKDQ